MDDPFLQVVGGLEVRGVRALGGAITGFTKHGINQAISREGVGVSSRAILDAVKNPVKTVLQSEGRRMFIGRDARVVLNPAGEVITVQPLNRGAFRISR